jgi:Na+-driven multidrug efflux pump
MGDLKITLMSTFMQMVGRVIASYILAPRLGVAGIAVSCFLGWIVMLTYEVPFFVRDLKKNK